MKIQNQLTKDKETLLKKIGRTIKSTREYKHLTQEQLGEICDMNTVYISQIERGVKNASIVNIIRLCKGLDITPDVFFKMIVSGPTSEAMEVKNQIYGFLLQHENVDDLKKILNLIKAYFE